MNEQQSDPIAEIARLRQIIDDYSRICKAASEEIAMLRERLNSAILTPHKDVP